jgi:hypothetical protein
MVDPPPPATLPNPKLAELRIALSDAQSVTRTCSHQFDGAVAAMNAQAWVSSIADTFYAELTTNAKNATAAGQGCVDNVQAAITACPATVPNPKAKTS